MYLGIKSKQAIRAFNSLKIEGLVEALENNLGYAILLDYSDNAKEIGDTLKGLRSYVTGKIITIIGADENLSEKEREQIGEIIAKKVDLAIVTTGYHNKKDPKDLSKDILKGIRKGKTKSIQILDRKEAIEYVIDKMEKRDLLVIFKNYNTKDKQGIEIDERKIITEIK